VAAVSRSAGYSSCRRCKRSRYPFAPRAAVSRGASIQAIIMSLSFSKSTQLYSDDSLYRGQVKDGRMHGVGRMEWTGGDSYEGPWKEGLMDGTGVYKFANGSRYQGQFKGNLRDGYGIFTYNDGSLYEGQWKNDKPHGTGKTIYPNGHVTAGEFKEGEQDVQGISGFQTAEQ